MTKCWAITFLCLCACASTATNSPQRDRRLVADTEAPDPGVLAQAEIPSGRCGTILWARAGAGQVPVFRSVDDGTASMVIDGQPTVLSLSGRAGETRVGIPIVQRFTAEVQDRPVTVTMRGVWGQPFPAGSYVARATLRVEGADGWSRIVPAAGIAGCRP